MKDSVNSNDFQVCARCVMDTSDVDIIFDKDGYCNHCNSAIKRIEKYNVSLKSSDENVQRIVQTIRKASKGERYDCVVGVSGGLDSSYLLYKVVELGLKPLAVHIDNGWNSELAVKNIENLLSILKVDLQTIVLDWEEFRDLQKAFLLSSVVDLEMLSDSAIVVGLYNVMKKNKIKYSLYGYNISMESIMPAKWFYSPKFDSLNIQDIYRKFGNNKKIINFPMLSYWRFLRLKKAFQEEQFIPLLNYMPYDKADALRVLQEKCDYTPYKYKHYESRITAFFQGYILPQKFHIDKRKAHLAGLICSGQLTRDAALLELNKPLYDELRLQIDKEFFLKKLEFTEEEFTHILLQPRKEHWDFKSYEKRSKILFLFAKKVYERIFGKVRKKQACA